MASNGLGDGGCVPESQMNEIGHVVQELVAGHPEASRCDSISAVDKRQLCVLKVIAKDEKTAGTKEGETARKFIVKYFKPATKSYASSYWLNNTEIDTLQFQLSSQFPGYYYSNIHMIDFGMFDPETQPLMTNSVFPLKEIDFCAEMAGRGRLTWNGPLKKFGCVVNTDVSTGRGIHWFSVFMDFESSPATIEYFNSSGLDIKNDQFKRWLMDLAVTVSKTCGIDCRYVRATRIQHQRHNTSNCGAYSLYYIWKRLNGTPVEWFADNKVDDESMQLFRKYILSTDSPQL